MPRKLKKATLIIANPAHDPSVYWVGGYWATDTITYLETPNGKRILFVTPFEVQCAKKEARRGIEIKPEKGIAALEKLLVSRGVTTIVVPETFPADAYRHFTRAGYELEVVSVLFPKRIKKTAREQKYMAQCQKAAESAFQHAVTLLANARIKNGVVYDGKQPLASETIRVQIRQHLLKIGYACPADVIVASGLQSYHPHHNGSGPLVANAPIVIDIFPQSLTTHYWGDFTRTVVKGKASNRLKKMYQAVQSAQKAAIEKTRTGTNFKEVDISIRTYFENQGFRTTKSSPEGFIHSLGHRIGLEIHEGPSLFSAQPELEEGDAITIEPGLYYSNIGGIRIEDLVVVTKNGCINLTHVTSTLLEL